MISSYNMNYTKNSEYIKPNWKFKESERKRWAFEEQEFLKWGGGYHQRNHFSKKRDEMQNWFEVRLKHDNII